MVFGYHPPYTLIVPGRGKKCLGIQKNPETPFRRPCEGFHKLFAEIAAAGFYHRHLILSVRSRDIANCIQEQASIGFQFNPAYAANPEKAHLIIRQLYTHLPEGLI